MSGYSAPHCGSLRASDEGRDVELYGWVARRRDMGGVIFIDLRDRWGKVQVVFNPAVAPAAHEAASDLRSEFVVPVAGSVRRRPSGSENPRLETGDIEVAASDLEVLSPSEPTPFPLEDSEEPDVVALIEGLFAKLWQDTAGVTLTAPFPRLDIKESFLRYGSDKPDLRYELEIADLGDALGNTKADTFRRVLAAGGVVRALSVPHGRDMARRELDELVTVAKGAGGQGLAWLPGGPLDKFLSEQEIESIKRLTGAGPDDLVLIAADRRRKAETVMGLIRQEIARRRKLIREGEWKFLWINPTYLFDEDDQGKLTYAHHPFTRPFAEDMPFVEERPYEVRAHAYDIVCNGYELGGGSLRIYDPGMQERVVQLLGMPLDVIRARFGTLLQAFTYGVPPHGGIAPGIDRIVMMLGGTDNIRDVIAFPKTQSMSDLMLGAPSEVDQSQLDELNIKVVPPKKDRS